MTIPDPIVQFGEPCYVKVLNSWRHGTIKALEYTNYFGSWSWSYYVQIVPERGARHRVYHRWVGNDGIRKLETA